MNELMSSLWFNLQWVTAKIGAIASHAETRIVKMFSAIPRLRATTNSGVSIYFILQELELELDFFIRKLEL